MFIKFSDGSQITVEDYYSVDAEGYYIVNASSFQSVSIAGWDAYEDYRDGNFDWVVGTGNSDKLYSSAINSTPEAGIIYTLSGRGGDDILYSGGGHNSIWGGEGDDTFYLSGDAQKTIIAGDEESSRSAGGEGELPIIIGENISFADSVYLEWQKSEVTLSNPREGYFRIEHAGTGSVVDIYDVENLYFSDGQGGYEYKPLTEGQVIGKAHWTGDAAGMDIEFEQHNVSFQVNGDVLKVLASATVEVTEEQFIMDTVWTSGEWSYNESEYSYSGSQWASWGYTPSEQEVSLGIQTFEKELDGVVIWEGNRTEVDAFEFADGVSVNVINVSTTDLADNPVFDTVGTDGIDLIFGNDGDNLIDGKGGDDIIFGGSGDDVIIGGEGDDVILGGDGADILRGDMVESGDAAVTAWQAAATQFNIDNPGENIVFDENKLSLQLSDSVDGDDLILGGDQLDDIESGDGKNFVSSGKADLDGNQQVDQSELDLINSQISDTSKLFDDDEWM